MIDDLCKIRDIYAAINSFEEEFTRVFEVKLNEGLMLCCISTYGEYTSGDIARQLGLSASNTSKLLASLEKKGMITRVIGDCDKRCMHFSLTADGEAKLTSIRRSDMDIPEAIKRFIE